MRKILLSAFLFLGLFSNSQNTKGDVFFGAAVVHTIDLNFTQTGYWDSLIANYITDVYMACNVVVDGSTLTTSGVKFKGNSSYNNPSVKKSFKLDFNNYVAGQQYDGLEKLNLNNGFKDPTIMREKIMLDFLWRAGIPGPRCAYTRVNINGTYWGLYTAVEEVNKDLLKDRFSDNKGNLFKGDPSGDLKWMGSAVNTYTSKYELKTNETANNWTDLIYLIDKINNSPVNYQDSLNKVLQVTPFLKAWAASNIFANLDSYIGSGHNYFVYHDSITNKFNWITWDVNEAFGNFTQGMTTTQIENLSISYTGGGAGNRPLCNKSLSNTSVFSSYVNEICYLTGYHFLQSYWFPHIDSLKNMIKSHVYADPNKFFNNTQFDSNIDTLIVVVGNPGGPNIAGLKSFFNRRRASLVTQMLANSCNVGLNEEHVTMNSIVVKPNPTTGKFWINTGGSAKKVVFYDVLGKEVDVELIKTGSDTEMQFSFEKLPKGLYFCKVGSEVKRIIHQ